jgi:hypothetical protein
LIDAYDEFIRNVRIIDFAYETFNFNHFRSLQIVEMNISTKIMLKREGNPTAVVIFRIDETCLCLPLLKPGSGSMTFVSVFYPAPKKELEVIKEALHLVMYSGSIETYFDTGLVCQWLPDE